MKKKYIITVKNTQEGLYLNDNLCTIERGKFVTLINNHSTGGSHSAYSNIDNSGSVKGMKNLGYWDKTDTIIKQGGYYYNISHVYLNDELDALAYFIQQNGVFPHYDIDNWKIHSFTFAV